MNANLKGSKIHLRLMQASDFEKMLAWENDPGNWRVSDTSAAFSEEDIRRFVSTPQDIYSTGQLRLIICLAATDEAIGAIDLFAFDGLKQSAGVGVLVEPAHRKKGCALEALTLLANYAMNEIGIRTLSAAIHDDNAASIGLFESAGFKKSATGKLPGQLFYQKDLTK